MTCEISADYFPAQYGMDIGQTGEKQLKMTVGEIVRSFQEAFTEFISKLQKRAHTNSTFAASLFMIYRKEKIRENPSLEKICESVIASPCFTMQLQVALGDLRLGENRPGRFISVARVVPLDRPKLEHIFFLN